MGVVSAGVGAWLAWSVASGKEAPSKEPAKAVSEPEPIPSPSPKPPPKASQKQPEEKTRRRIVDSRSTALTLKQLQSLGYVDGTYDPRSERKNVILYRRGKTYDGYNFYSSRRQRGANLVDMKGKTIHRWRASHKGNWQHVELLPNGDVIVLVKNRRLSRYDVRSQLLWSTDGRFHHDFHIHEGEIYALARVPKKGAELHSQARVFEDVVRVVSMDGEVIREISVLEALHESPYAFLLPSIPKKKLRNPNAVLDVLHTNHVEVFDGRLRDRDPIYAKGNILLSMRNVNAIAIIDGETEKVVWIWGPTNLTFQHHPTLLDNGNILLFDNGVDASRVLELDPLSYEIVWRYAPRAGFFSKTRGSNQRLPNGNTLITESDRGYAFEVTPDGRIVWKFANPRVSRKKRREAIWRMTRVDPSTLTFVD